MDSERSFDPKVITFIMESFFNIIIFRILSYTSSVNGQIEKFHSTLSEVMRCLKEERWKDYRNFWIRLSTNTITLFIPQLEENLSKPFSDANFTRIPSNENVIEPKWLMISKRNNYPIWITTIAIRANQRLTNRR